MKVMFLNALQEGGAARAAHNLMRGIQGREIDARLLVQKKTGNDPSVIGPRTKIEEIIGSVWPVVEWMCVGLYACRKGCSFSPALMPDRLQYKVAEYGPDIIHLNWVTNGFMRVETLRRFNLPAVWTLHDSWAFTGGCHVPFACTRYQDVCGKCPVLRSSLSLDPSRWLWYRKQRAWRDLNLTVVAPSRWLGKCAEASSLFRDKRVEVIPNGLDLQIYKPFDKRAARDLLLFPQDKKLIIFGGMNVTSDRNKGFHLFEQAVRILTARHLLDNAEIVIFGSSGQAQIPDLGLKVRNLGWLSEESDIALLYAAGDVCIVPSLQENLPYAAMESMACGTPCVAFDQGGMSDIISHRDNGYLARPFEPDDLAQGIAWILEDEERRKILSFQSRQKVEQEFALEKVAGRYLELYREIINSAA